MTLTPDPYQIEGADWLAGRYRGMLADEPGLGKTLQAIMACDRVPILTVLIVCPASLVTHWRRTIESERLGGWTAFVTSYEGMMGRDAAVVANNPWCVVIFDEGHYLKNATAKRTKVAYGDLIEPPGHEGGLINRCEYAWVLTGTPMPNHSGELYSHMRALDVDRVRSPKTKRPWTQEQFEAHYCQMVHGFAGMKIVGTKNDAQLNEKLDGFMLRRLARDVMQELPEMRVSPLFFNGGVTDEDLGLDPNDVKLIRKALADGDHKALRKLKPQFAAAARLTAIAKTKPVIEWLRMWLETTDKKIVVFGYHTEPLRAVYHAKGINPFAVKIEGMTSVKSRQGLVDQFQEDPMTRLLIGQGDAAGTGYTMTAAADMLCIELSWVPGDNEQVWKRIARKGQTKKTNIRCATLAGTIDEDIQTANIWKARSIANVLGDA